MSQTITDGTVKTQIIVVLESHGEIKGTEALAELLEIINSKWWVRRCAQSLARDGVITIRQSNGGRGHPTVYKRNRNQPGIPRKQR